MSDTHALPSAHPSPAAMNPFARAMAEAKGGKGDSSVTHDSSPMGDMSSADLAEQQRQQAEKLKRDRLRLELHKQVNPVEATDVFNAEKMQVKKQIDEVRYELKLMVAEVAAFHKEIELTIMANVPDAGTQGKYHFSFFEKLKNLIKLLRQQIHSARTWATAISSKKKKKQQYGLEVTGSQDEQTATIYDQMHHERSTQYSGS